MAWRAGCKPIAALSLGGDPDRPFIAGAVPNTTTPSPVTEDNNTQNVLQTGGETRLEIEDDDGKQYIWLRTPPKDTYLKLGHPTLASHNITLHTEANALYDIGSNQVIEVGGHLDEQVTGDVTETYMAKQDSTIDGPQTTKVNQSVSEIYLSTQKTTVSGSQRKETFNNGHTTVTVGARSETYKAAQEQKVDGTTNEIWVGNWKRKSGETKETYDGDRTDIVLGPVMQLCPSGITEKYGDTMGLYMSKLWIGGTREYNAPNTTEINLIKHTMKGEVKDIKNMLSGWDATSIGATGFNLESLGIVIEVVPSLKLSVTGVNIGLYGADGSMCAHHLSITVLKVIIDGSWILA